jgi:sulfite exporter TauE/SafE
MEGFLLGLASGITCLAYCASVLTPFMLGEGNKIRRNGFVLAQFLLGRLLGYLLFGAAAWLAGQLLIKDPRSSMRKSTTTPTAKTILNWSGTPKPTRQP